MSARPYKLILKSVKKKTPKQTNKQKPRAIVCGDLDAQDQREQQLE